MREEFLLLAGVGGWGGSYCVGGVLTVRGESLL